MRTLIWSLVLGLMVAATAQEPPERSRNRQPAQQKLPTDVRAIRDLPYAHVGEKSLLLDLFLPESSQGPLPLIIWIHGGGWQNGSKENCPVVRQGFVARGYAVASINYRLSAEAIFPAQIEDCKAAVRWLRAHAKEYGLNPDRFGAWGSSAGGHLVALLGTSDHAKEFERGAHLDVSSRVQAVCDYYGPTDLEQMARTPGYERHAQPDAPESKLLGGAVLENKSKADKASPISYVTNSSPPFLIVHGDKDPVVPPQQSELLYEALRKAGVNVQLHTIKGAGHGQGFGGKDVEELVNRFFDHCLKGTPADLKTTRTESSASQPPATVAGALRQGQAARGPRISFEQVRAREDADGDGRVTRKEFKGPPALFTRFDRNGDGVLTKDDFTEGDGTR